jgi:FKBP-type peptidyl-prolyl cis-trans isomerase FkpA
MKITHLCVLLGLSLAAAAPLNYVSAQEPAAKESEVVTTKSGLKIQDLLVGDGQVAIPKKDVTVNYRGTLEDGTVFDQSYGREPFTFELGNGEVIKGWDEGVQGMKVGGKRKLIIPASLGYGPKGRGNVIPPNATLIFEVELLRVR